MKIKIAKTDEIVLFIYFSIMLNLYTNTIIQLIAQLFLITYVVFKTYRSATFSFSQVTKSYIKWYGLFGLWIFLSLAWTGDNQLFDGFRTHITVLRIFIMGFIILQYLNIDKNNIATCFRSYTYAGVMFVIINILTNPITAYGNENFISFDNGYVRTGIAEICFDFMVIGIYFYKKGLFTKCKFYIIELLFFICILMTGARKPLVMIPIFIVMTVLLSRRISRNMLKRSIVAIIFVVFLCLLGRSFILSKTQSVKSIFMMLNATDASTVGRFTYIVEAFNLSKQHWIIGTGVDSFKFYLCKNIVRTPFGILAPVYTHCNYTEILLNFGIVGIVLWYDFYYVIIRKHWRHRRNTYSSIILSILFIWLLGDIGTVVYMSHVLVYFYVILLFISNNEVLIERYNRE